MSWSRSQAFFGEILSGDVDTADARMPICFYEMDTIEEIWRQDGAYPNFIKNRAFHCRSKALSFAFAPLCIGDGVPSQASSRRL
jgi:hypothetical protein